MTDIDEAMAKAVDIGENDVSFLALLVILGGVFPLFQLICLFFLSAVFMVLYGLT